jgi:hypothetical protein
MSTPQSLLAQADALVAGTSKLLVDSLTSGDTAKAKHAQHLVGIIEALSTPYARLRDLVDYHRADLAWPEDGQ